MSYDSGPGRKWLFFVGGAVTSACFALIPRDYFVITVAWVGMAIGLLGAAAHARRCRVTTDTHGVTIRLWAGRRHVAWHQITAVEVTPIDPKVMLITGEAVRLLDNWHAHPAEVADAVRRRWLEMSDQHHP